MPVKLDISGLEKLKEKMQGLSGTHSIPLSELLPDEFMTRNTEFPNLQVMADAGGVNEPSDITSEAFSQFVSAHSRFSSYTEMLRAGYGEYAKRKLEL